MLDSLIEQLAELDLWLLLLAVFMLSAAESAIGLDFVVPGEVAMVVAGTVLAEGDGPVAAGMACAAAGAIVGDSISYALGATLGTRAIERWGWVRRRLGPQLDRARRYFDRRGGGAVFAGRWIGALRAVVPFVAGTSGMRYRRFLAWDVPAAITWGAFVVGIGAAFGDDVVDVVERFDWVVTLTVGLLIAGWIASRIVRSRRTGRGATDLARYPDPSDRGG